MKPTAAMNTIPLSDRASFNLAFLLEHYFPTRPWVTRRKELARQRAAQALSKQHRGTMTPVERVSSVSPAEFRKRYLSRGVPVIIENGCRTWPLASRWSFDQFRARYGSEMIKLVQHKGVAADHEVIEGREFSEEIQLGALIDQLLAGGGKYMRFSPLLEKFPELLDDFDHAFFKQMTGNNWGITYQLFMGGPGTFTPLHNAITPFFFVNVCGVKRWELIPNHYLPVLYPDADGFGYNHSKVQSDLSNLADYPGFDHVDRLDVVMQPGDILFLPPWMWHSVKNDSPTIGIRCGFISPRSMLAEAFTLSFIRLFAARNPSTLESLYYVFFEKNLPQRDRRLLAAKLIRR